MKMIRNKYVSMAVIKNVYKIIFSFILIFILSLTIPGRNDKVYAAPLEDCDLDGFDDATGVPVPWPGYDETKGDTPDGPAGSKVPATVSGSNTNNSATGNSDSAVPGKINNEDSKKTDVKSESLSDTSTGKTNSTKSQNTSKAESVKANSNVEDKTKSGKTESTPISKASTSTQDSAGREESAKTNAAEPAKINTTAKEDTNKVASGNTGNEIKDNAGKEESDNKDTGVNDNTGVLAAGITNGTAADNTDGGAGDGNAALATSVTIEGNSQEEAPLNETEQSEADIEDTDNVNNSNTDSSNEIETIINTKGLLEITEAAGSMIHAGSSIIISGFGFAENINDLEIVIQPEAVSLGFVKSSENGSFETQLNVPEDLKTGTYQIAILYQGKEITNQETLIGAKAADSFLQALSVGFTKDNKGLVPGLFILLGLFISGIGAMGTNIVIRSRQSKN